MTKKDFVHISGIDLPKKLYDAARNNELVIFVGAGVSIPSNIPNFVGLTNEIIKGSNYEFNGDMSPSENLERAELEEKGVNIRRETRRIINQKNKGFATTHRCLVNFYRNNTMRLVTTNFDLNLSKAAKGENIEHETYYHPALPTGDEFDGIVYLHGAVTDDEKPLIITEKDFARAYLKYGRQTAFVRELFSKYTVLFIGYSYDDKVIQLITKSDADDKHRKDNPHYVLLQDTEYLKDPDKWKVLGLEAIPYQSSKNHEYLWSMIEEWGNWINLKPSEQQKEIIKISRKKSDISRQESDYIKCCLEQDHLSQIFFSNAKSEKWIEWAYREGLFDSFFKEGNKLSDTESRLCLWFTDNFVAKGNKTSLDIVTKNKSKHINSYLVDMIALSLYRAKKLPVKRILTKWIHFILTSPQSPSKEYLIYILLKCRIPHHIDIAILLFSEVTRPNISQDENHASATKHWIKEIWTRQFKPKISQTAIELEPIITHHLKLHEHHNKAEYGLNIASYTSRAAIEERLNNHKYYFYDILVDIARDIIDYLLFKEVDIATETINRWYKQNVVILKRLSIYGMVNHKKLDISIKLEWLLNKNDLMNPVLRHENFSLIQTIYPLLNNKQKIKLINAAEKESETEYSIYNFVVWLNSSSPECEIALSKLDEIKKNNPDFEPRSNHDLGSYMTSGWVGHVSPILVEGLLKMELKDAIQLLDTYKGEGGFNKPERQGLIDTLQDAIKQDSKWSLNIAEELADKEIWHKDVWSKVLHSWSEVKGLADSDLKSIIMFLLEHKNLHVHHYEIARLLTVNEENLFKTTKIESESTKLAAEVMDIAFKDEYIGRVIISEDIPDWWSEAINSTGYYLCYFFVRLFDKKYKKSKSQISKLNEFFLPFLKNNSYSAQMGKITLAHYLHFFFSGVDEEWTKNNIIPLFDWTINKQDALQSWQAYLYAGTWSKNLFEDLLSLHKKTFNHFKGLGESRDNYCQHVAGFTLYSVIFAKEDPLKTGWLRAFIKHCEEEDLRSFAMGIYLFLKDNKDVKENSKTIWNNLLKPYIDQRISGKPQTLCKQEFQWMLQWCLHLEHDFTESVKVMIEADKDCDLIENQGNFHTDIFRYFNESDLFKREANTSGELVEHLLSKGYVSKWDNRELKQTIQTLEENGCKKSIVSRIRELAIGLGINIESD